MNPRSASQLAFAVVSLLAGVAGVSAAEIAVSCPAAGFGAELSLRLSGEKLTVTDAAGTTELPAALNGDPAGMFTIDASGPMEAAMPVLADLESCVAGKLQQQGAPATDTDALTYVLNLCRLQLQSAATAQTIAARLVLTSMAPGSGSLLISRSYVEPSQLTTTPLQLDEWPMRQCSIVVQ